MAWMIRVQFLAGARKGILLFATASRLALGPTQPPIQWVPWALSPRVKWPGHEADHFYLVPRLRMHGAIHPLPHASSWCCALVRNGDIFMAWYLVKHRYNFTLCCQEH